MTMRRDANAWKPPFGTQPSGRNPLASGLAFLAPFAAGSGTPGAIVPQSSSVAVAAPNLAWAADAYGPAGVFNGTSTDVTYAGVPGVGAPITVACRASVASNGGNYGLVSRAPTNACWELFFESGAVKWRGSAAADHIAYPSSGITTGVLHTFVLTDTGSAQALWIDGAKVATASVASAPPAATAGTIFLGALPVPAYWLSGHMDWAGIWGRILADDEVAAISRNPWQIFGSRLVARPTVAAVPPSSAAMAATGHADAAAMIAATSPPSAAAMSASGRRDVAALLAVVPSSGPPTRMPGRLTYKWFPMRRTR